MTLISRTAISLLGLGCNSEIDVALREEISMRASDTGELKSRISSTSSTATSDSQGEDGAETPVVRSDDEDAHNEDDDDDEELLRNETPPANRVGEVSELSLWVTSLLTTTEPQCAVKDFLW